MTLFKKQYRIESTRLPGWDYASAGWYFITICTKDRRCVFGTVEKESVRLSTAGTIITAEWLKTPQVRSDVALDEWVVMPNHLHGVIVMLDWVHPSETPHRGVSTKQSKKSYSLGTIVGQFKSACIKRIWATGFDDFAWQPRFFDHIIRNEKELDSIREYIVDNPLKWELEKDNPENLYM